jgi:peptidoglycan-N-acetylglucosamine deacetylase
MTNPYPEGDLYCESFTWPEGTQAAVSLTFDDARISQITTGIPILDRYGAHATFYVSLNNLTRRLDEWRKAAAAGHEIGNHTTSHPCSRGLYGSLAAYLESFTLASIEADIVSASAELESLLGRRPVSFAYPCGQTYVGEGELQRSYKPVIAKHFMTGRGFPQSRHNDPATLRPEYLLSRDLDRATAGQAVGWMREAAAESGWLIFTGHEIGDGSVRQTVDSSTLETLLRVATEEGILVGTVEEISTYILANRPSQ